MFKKSRKKILLSIMGALVLLFVLTLLVLLLASDQEMRQKNAELLERYVSLYSLEDNPGKTPEREMLESNPEGTESRDREAKEKTPEPPEGRPPESDPPDYELSTFYSVAFAEDGTVLEIDDGKKNLYSREELVEMARKMLLAEKASGETGSLIYRVERKDGYTLVAFKDTTLTGGSISMLLRNIVIIGSSAIVVLFFVALLLAHIIIRPLEENDRRQRQFISDASHELKTPISVIGANAELLAREIGENEWLANIQYENERMGELVQQLLDLSRTEGTANVAETVDFSRVVTGEVLAIECLAFERGRRFQSEIEEGIELPGSKTELTRLVSILLDNAVQYATGSTIDISLKRSGHTAEFLVGNEAEEIPLEKLEHLFDRFYRVDEARSGEGRHYGLGLSIAKAVAEKHGGRISVSCGNGRVLFVVTLPVSKNKGASQA